MAALGVIHGLAQHRAGGLALGGVAAVWIQLRDVAAAIVVDVKLIEHLSQVRLLSRTIIAEAFEFPSLRAQAPPHPGISAPEPWELIVLLITIATLIELLILDGRLMKTPIAPLLLSFESIARAIIEFVLIPLHRRGDTLRIALPGLPSLLLRIALMASLRLIRARPVLESTSLLIDGSAIRPASLLSVTHIHIAELTAAPIFVPGKYLTAQFPGAPAPLIQITLGTRPPLPRVREVLPLSQPAIQGIEILALALPMAIATAEFDPIPTELFPGLRLRTMFTLPDLLHLSPILNPKLPGPPLPTEIKDPLIQLGILILPVREAE